MERLPTALTTRAGLLVLLLLLAACTGVPDAGVAGEPEPAELALPEPVEVSVPAQWKFADLVGTAPERSGAGMVTSDARLATGVGVAILDAGGNALDAAVATAFALAVVYPVAGNIGGGGFMVARMADGELATLDFREKAPMAAHRDMYLNESGEVTRDAVVGHRASGVPGSVAGLWEAHARFGSMSWEELVAPSIRLAVEGFVADPDFAGAADGARFEMFEGSRALFRPGGEPVAEGDYWANPDLAVVLQRVSDTGPDGFYSGPTADLIVAEMERGGGLITHADLSDYAAIWREPVLFEYRGYEVVSMPPPSSGGLTLGLMANILEGYDMRALGWHSAASVHRLAEAMRCAFADRNHWLGDPDFVPVPRQQFLSEEYAARLRAGIREDAATPSSQIDPAFGSDGSEAMHTTHFSVVDSQGNAVGLTTTINHGNGSGVTVAGAGFLMNNEMDDFASKPGSPNAFGLVQGEANSIQPGKRMLSAMTPTVVSWQGRPVLVTGASGGPTIITGVLQIMTNVIDYGLDVRTAVALPRFHQQHLPDLLLYEGGGYPAELLEQLQALGHELMPGRFDIAVGASLLQRGDGWTGAHDPRALGLAKGQ